MPTKFSRYTVFKNIDMDLAYVISCQGYFMSWHNDIRYIVAALVHVCPETYPCFHGDLMRPVKERGKDMHDGFEVSVVHTDFSTSSLLLKIFLFSFPSHPPPLSLLLPTHTHTYTHMYTPTHTHTHTQMAFYLPDTNRLVHISNTTKTKEVSLVKICGLTHSKLSWASVQNIL